MRSFSRNETQVFNYLQNKEKVVALLQSINLELEQISLPTKEHAYDIELCKEETVKILNYYNSDNFDFDSEEFKHLSRCLLDTYFVYLDTQGTDVERVTWLESSIQSFLEATKNLDSSQVSADTNFEVILRNTKGGIEDTYYNSSRPEMKAEVSNYSVFEERLKKLGIAESANHS